MLSNLLQTCGLNTTEQAVFLHLFERGESIASILAKQLRLKRTTVYAALDNLVHFGIVSRKRRGSISYFNCLAPELVAKVLEGRAKQQFEDVHLATRLLQTHLKELLPKAQDFGGFEISTFESVEAIYAQLSETLEKDEFSAFFNPQMAITNDTFKTLIKNFLKSTAKTQANIREILVAGPMSDWYKSQIKNPNHKIKEIGKNVPFQSDIIMADDYVILNNYHSKKEVGVKIREKYLHESMLALFNMTWESL